MKSHGNFFFHSILLCLKQPQKQPERLQIFRYPQTHTQIPTLCTDDMTTNLPCGTCAASAPWLWHCLVVFVLMKGCNQSTSPGALIICKYIFFHTHTTVTTYAHMHTHMHAHSPPPHTHTHLHTPTHTPVYAHTHTCTCAHAHIHTHTHTHIQGIHLVIFIEIIPLLVGSLTTAAFAQQCQGGTEGRLEYQAWYALTQI